VDPSGDQPQENRGERRFDVYWYMRAGHASGEDAICHVLNVSLSGLLFRSSKEYSPGDLIEVVIWMQRSLSIRGLVRIVRRTARTGAEPEYGGAFVSFEDDGRQQLGQELLRIRRQQLGTEYARIPLFPNKQ